jgi:hypothetical protein
MRGMLHSRRIDSPFHARLAIGVVLAFFALLAAAAADVAAQPPPPPKPVPPPVPPVPPVPTVPQLPSLPQVPDVPEVPKDPDKLADLVTPLSSRLILNAQKGRPQGLPATLKFSGWLMPPMRLNRVDGFFERTFGIDLGVCRGPVTVAYKSGGRVIARRRARVNRMCAFNSSITIRSRGALGPRRRLRATARFDGNTLLGPAQHSIAVRLG